MLNDALVHALLRAHLGLSFGLIAVLLLRKPWRRLAGAQAAYALWALPVWLMVAALLPRAGLPVWTLPPVLVMGPSAPTLAGAPSDVSQSLVWIWLAGVLAMVAWQAAQHHRYARRLTASTRGRWLAPAGDSPGLLGAWRPRLVLPADFRQRFDAAERRWILAHEVAHARRFDNTTRVLATMLATLAWFNPLAWRALAALRHDQELACDAAVMQRYPWSWRRYGLAMLKLDGACRLPPAASAWQSHHPLKERIMLLKKNATPRTRAHQVARAALALSALLGLAAVQTISSAADAKPAARKLKAAEACTKMSRPELPDVDVKGEFLLDVTFKIGSGGRPDKLRFQGDGAHIAPLVTAIERSVRAYECKTALAGVEVQQEFMFKID